MPKSGITIKDKGAMKAIKSAKDRIKSGLHKALMRQGREMTTEIKNSIISTTNKSGEYIDNIKKSNPGEPPANRTGTLVRSISYGVKGERELEIGAKVNYGKFLEHGTEKMEPRPFIEPVVKKNNTKMKQTMSKEVKKEVNKR